MPSGRAHPSGGRSCERLRRAAGALAAEGGVALVARDKTVLETAREAVSAASGRRVTAVSCDTGDDQSVRDLVPAVTDGLAELRRAIAEGQALPVERLPPARGPAAVLWMNRNTVLPALRLLCDEGLLKSRRGHGITAVPLQQALRHQQAAGTTGM